jgi:enoyl-CoA hydratase/carnithine racemase
MESESSARITWDIDGGVANVELVREGKFNAMDGHFFAAFGDAMRSLGTDSRVRAILVSARGRHFSAGLDLAYAATQFAPSNDAGRAAESRLRHIHWLQDSFSAIEQARAPVVAAVHGGCIGAGVDLISACDLRVASADAFLQVAEVDVAITADLGTLQRLTHLVPEGVARELAYTGRKMGALEAQRFGLWNRLEDSRDAAIAAGLELARAIAAKSPMAVAGIKQSLNYSRGRTVEEGLRHVALWNAGTLLSGDLTAALQARRAKQEASFPDLDP